MDNTTLNSCEVPGMPEDRYCSGHGKCVKWGSSSRDMQEASLDPYFTRRPELARNEIAFCRCNRDWADPECRTRRKSQLTAYLLSLFLGPFGADRFYLDEPILGAAKLATLGGGLVWWVFDAVYIGAAPPYSGNYRTAYDLPHWCFVASSTIFFGGVGLLLFTLVANSLRREQMRNWMLHEAEDAFHESKSAVLLEKPMNTTIGMPTYATTNVLTPVGYGATESPWLERVSRRNPWSAWWIRHTANEKNANRYGPRADETAKQQRDWALHEAVPVCSVPAV
eukprot:CAMPEP_0178450392 /NCGR_PEP_ID=MMETSP0689_2-20121128/43099_1 /TAXON_ID=160604 /ORGANISM="Amphidinium massartii, Strain CS-259" /LENGTH=280 /DNA_ID=CAMNT_0020075853 /DNA_START=347 /DNA_END=1185 /DNA_ORIENTATION=-